MVDMIAARSTVDLEVQFVTCDRSSFFMTQILRREILYEALYVGYEAVHADDVLTVYVGLTQARPSYTCHPHIGACKSMILSTHAGSGTKLPLFPK